MNISSVKKRDLDKVDVDANARCMLIDMENELSNVSNVCTYELYFETDHTPISIPLAKDKIAEALDIIHANLCNHEYNSDYVCYIRINSYNNLNVTSDCYIVVIEDLDKDVYHATYKNNRNDNLTLEEYNNLEYKIDFNNRTVITNLE